MGLDPHKGQPPMYKWNVLDKNALAVHISHEKHVCQNYVRETFNCAETEKICRTSGKAVQYIMVVGIYCT